MKRDSCNILLEQVPTPSGREAIYLHARVAARALAKAPLCTYGESNARTVHGSPRRWQRLPPCSSPRPPRARRLGGRLQAWLHSRQPPGAMPLRRYTLLATYCFVRAAFAKRRPIAFPPCKLIVYDVVVNMLAVCLLAVTACTDAAAAMAGLRAGNRFEVVLVDMHSLGCGAPAFELLECAVGEMHVETYGNYIGFCA
jgi:hypothetical protein